MKTLAASAILLVLPLFMLPACSGGHLPTEGEDNAVMYVRPTMGTASNPDMSYGGTCPAVSLPWGMNAWTPCTQYRGSYLTYDFSSVRINGFMQTHTVSPYEQDFGTFSIMPVRGGAPADMKGRASIFAHKQEEASPSYYRVFLATHNIDVEFSALDYSAVFRFRFNAESGSNDVIIDLVDSCPAVSFPDDTTLCAAVSNNEGAPLHESFRNYIRIVADCPFERTEIIDTLPEGGRAVRLVFPQDRKDITLRCGTSFISAVQAQRNLVEQGWLTVEQMRRISEERWNSMLGRFSLGNASDEEKELFYTVLYRALLTPKKMYENTGGLPMYRGLRDGRLYSGKMWFFDKMYIRSFSQFPMLNLFYPDVASEMYAAMGEYLVQDSPERMCMGDLSNYCGFLKIAADAVCKHLASASGGIGELFRSVSGACAFQADTGKVKIRTSLASCQKSAVAWLAHYLSDTSAVQHGPEHSHELCRDTSCAVSYSYGGPWQNRWVLDFDMSGIISSLGGKAALCTALDSLFSLPPDDYMYETQMLHAMTLSRTGRYCHAYVPMHSVPYMYSYSDNHFKGHYWCRKILETYNLSAEGYMGEDSSGAMSSWFVLSSLGIYPMVPVSGQYIIGSPLFRQVFVDLPGGNKIWFSSSGHQGAPYVRSVTVNGKIISRPFVTWDELMEGGSSFHFNMSETPSGITDSDTDGLYSFN